MRLNVYAEELTEETELVTKVVDEGTSFERTFYGVRVYLKSPPELHHSPEDDDRSAITFWVPWTEEGGHDFGAVMALLIELHDKAGVGAHRELQKRVAKRETTTV